MSDSSATNEAIRRTVYFSGRVQGVGFRYTTKSIARDFRVTGFVRNLPDGRVELVAEGTRDEINRFVASIADTMRSNIHEQTSMDEPPTGEFPSFQIAH